MLKIKSISKLSLIFINISIFTLLITLSLCSTGQQSYYQLYPFIYDLKPGIKSPAVFNDSVETITVITKENKYAVVPVTMEDGKPLLYSYKIGTYMGKDEQTQIAADFPELAKTGLHDEDKLISKKMITGIPIDIINCTAMPNAYSISGFLAEDEDLISVLTADNRLVRQMGLTHPQLAKPLFHVWNLILKEIELGNWGNRFYDNIKMIDYNNNLLEFNVGGSKGWQISIFFDEIQGRHDIHLKRVLTESEIKYLDSKYNHLNTSELSVLKEKLTRFDFSEMLPYYIMRYGFYEGHTYYRCDPIAIAFIFGLLSIEEIDQALHNDLYNCLTTHHTT